MHRCSVAAAAGIARAVSQAFEDKGEGMRRGAVVSSWALLIATACGGSSGPTAATAPALLDPPAIRLPFVFALRNHDLWIFRADPESGALTAVSVTRLGRSDHFAVHPSRPYLYTTESAWSDGQYNEKITGYQIDAEGKLRATESALVPTSSLQSLWFDPSGDRLYVAGSSLAMCRLRTDGAPELVTADAFSVRDPRGIAFSARFAYVMQSNGTHVLAMDPTTGLPVGPELQTVEGSMIYPTYDVGPSMLGSLFVAVASTREYGPTGLLPYAIDQTTGLLTPLASVPLLRDASREHPGSEVNQGTRGFVVHPAGRFVYVSETVTVGDRQPWSSHTDWRLDGSWVSAYRFDPETPRITRVGEPVRVDGMFVKDLDLSPDGRFLYGGAPTFEPDRAIVGFRVDPQTGGLTLMRDAAFTFPNS
jgi:6-phosphogluconolactonase (cycloisomerase 2 family)